MAETPTGFAVSDRFQDLASTTMVAFGQQLPSLCLVAAHLCAPRPLAARTVRCLHASEWSFRRAQIGGSPHVCATNRHVSGIFIYVHITRHFPCLD